LGSVIHAQGVHFHHTTDSATHETLALKAAVSLAMIDNDF